MTTIEKLKELAEKWGNTTVGSKESADASWEIYQAIMALLDNQDLVEMAVKATMAGAPLGRDKLFCSLAEAVIDRFGKKEPRKFEGWSVWLGDKSWYFFQDKDEALKYIKKYENNNLWLAKIIATEEV